MRRTIAGTFPKLHRHDRAAIGVLVGLPVVMFVLPALAGFPVMPGDDLTQNFPLRVLAGSQLRHGHLPLFDPYIWSGAPLLGGWNAGAVYPLTLLFAVLPGVTAWTVNMTATWWVAGMGTFAFLRASRLATVASFLGALSFAFAGSMTAQLSHFGLVAGMSWVPVALLASLRLSQRQSTRARLAWSVALAGAVALVILAGEPRAIDDAVIVVGSYVAWRAWRLGTWARGSAYLAVVLAGVALGVAVAAVQWLPGLEAVATSQRAAYSTALFDSGSLPGKWLLLLLVPDLLGGSGSFSQPAFFASYNLTEVTSYVGLMPLVAACALLGHLRWRRGLPEWAVWHVIAAVGVLLALGGNTPLGHVLAHLPIFDAQRLQSRNMMIADFALAALLAHWADYWLGERQTRWRRGALARRLVGAVPGIAAVVAVAAALAWGGGMMRWLGVNAAGAGRIGALRPWLVPSLVLGGLAVALVVWGPRLRPDRRVKALVWFVSADIVAFTLLSVVAVAPGQGRAESRTGAALSRTSPLVVPVGKFTHGGRFAIYDPGLFHAGELTALGVPDGNVLSKTPSIEGYSAIVNARYAAATGSHKSTGDGQDVLDPRAIGDGTLDQLDTTVLLAPARYLITPTGAAPGTAHPGRGFRNLAPHQFATWYFAAQLSVTSVAIPVAGTPGRSGRGFRIGLVRSSGSTEWIAGTLSRDSLEVSLARSQQAVAVRVSVGSGRADLAPPVVSTAGGARYRADGQLQDALVPPRWMFSGFDGAFAVFRDTRAKPPLTLRALPHRTTAGTLLRATAGPESAPTSAYVSSAGGVTVVRAVADIRGWTASWRPVGGNAVDILPIRRSGLVQAVNVPAGSGTITWRYKPPGALLGVRVSLVALAVLLGASVIASSAGRRRRRGEWTRPEGHTGVRRGLTFPANR